MDVDVKDEVKDEENEIKTEEIVKEETEGEKEKEKEDEEEKEKEPSEENKEDVEKDNLNNSDELLTSEEQKDLCQEMDETLPTIQPLPDTTLAAVASSIDGNVQYDAEPTLTAPTTKIKINISKPLPTPSENIVSGSGESESDKAELSESDDVPLPPPEPKLVKEKMQGRTFIELPPVTKDRELSGLCSIM